MKNLLKYFLMISLGIGITNKTFSPDTNVYAKRTFLELKKEIKTKKAESEKRKKMIEELNKPVSDFYIPVDTGQVSCIYGKRKDNSKNEELHKGIDIGILGNASLKSAQRPEVLAAAPGIVDFAGNETGYGKVVKIKHNNDLETIYAHLNNFFVKEGDSVLAQQKIGEMGRTGKVRSDKKSSKIHLHFEARKNNKPFNPAKYFKDYEKIRIDDTLYSSLPENNLAYSLPIENTKQLNEINSNKTPESFYEIQISASLNHLSKNQIKNLEKLYKNSVKETKEEVYKNGQEKMYYKYSVGKFQTLEKAVESKNSFNSRDNLGIIVYKEGKISETNWNF